MGWKNPFTDWAILTVGLAFLIYLLVQAGFHVAIAGELHKKRRAILRKDEGEQPPGEVEFVNDGDEREAIVAEAIRVRGLESNGVMVMVVRWRKADTRP